MKNGCTLTPLVMVCVLIPAPEFSWLRVTVEPPIPDVGEIGGGPWSVLVPVTSVLVVPKVEVVAVLVLDWKVLGGGGGGGCCCCVLVMVVAVLVFLEIVVAVLVLV